MLKRSVSRRSFLTNATLATAGCCIAQASSHEPTPKVAGESSLRVHAASSHLLYGSAVSVPSLKNDPAYARLLREQCSILVPENCMKWHNVEPQQDRFDFEQADYLVDFAEKERIKMRGTTLIWHEHVPDWATPTNVQTLMKEHITRVMSRYAGRIHSWDVVNEAIEPKDGRPDGLRKSKWLEFAGDGYIEAAYRAARLADPAALLTYNDYGIESESPEAEQRRIAVLLLLRRLRARNVPIDAVGIQSHISAGPSHEYGSGLRRFIASARELDLQVFITELDANDSGLPQDIQIRDTAVAAAYSRFLNAALPDPAVKAVLTWGITQKYSWLQQHYKNPGARGLPFDSSYKPTSAFNAMRGAFDARRTNLQKPVPASYVPFRPRA